MAKSQLKHVQISPRPRELAVGLVGDYDWDTERPGSGSEVTVRGQFAAGKVYQIRLAPQMRSTSGYTVGEGTGGRALSRSFRVNGSAGLHLSAGGIFPASASPVAGVQTRWVKSVQVRAAPIDRSQAARLVLAEKGFRMGTLGKDEKPISDWGLPPATIASRHFELSPKGPTAWSDLALDLRDLVGAVRGAIVVEVEAESVIPAQTAIQPRLPQPMRSLFWVTDLAPIVFQSPTRVVVKVVRLSDTQPVVGARIARYDRDATTLLSLGQTDSTGLLVLERNGDEGDEKLEGSPLLVVDPAGFDYTVIRLSGQRPTVRGHKQTAGVRANEALLLGMVTERDAYRPGEVVYVVAWAAIDTPYAQSGLRALPAGTAAEFSIYDRSDKQVDRQTAELDANGKFWAKLRIAAGTPLGYLKLEAQVLGIKKDEHVRLERPRQLLSAPEHQAGHPEQHDCRRGSAPTGTAGSTSRHETTSPSSVDLRHANQPQCVGVIDVRAGRGAQRRVFIGGRSASDTGDVRWLEAVAVGEELASARPPSRRFRSATAGSRSPGGSSHPARPAAGCGAPAHRG